MVAGNNRHNYTQKEKSNGKESAENKIPKGRNPSILLRLLGL